MLRQSMEPECGAKVLSRSEEPEPVLWSQTEEPESVLWGQILCCGARFGTLESECGAKVCTVESECGARVCTVEPESVLWSQSLYC